MKKWMQRSGSLLLAVVLLFTLPSAAFATDATEDVLFTETVEEVFVPSEETQETRSVQFNVNFPRGMPGSPIGYINARAFYRVQTPVYDGWPFFPRPIHNELTALFHNVGAGEGQTFAQVMQPTGTIPMISGTLSNLRGGRLESVADGSAVSAPADHAWFVNQTQFSEIFGGWYNTAENADAHTSAAGRITASTVIQDAPEILHVYARWYPTQEVRFNLTDGGRWNPGTTVAHRRAVTVETAEGSVLGPRQADFSSVLDPANRVLPGVCVSREGGAPFDPASLVRPGYIFTGWRTAPNGGGDAVTSTTQIADRSDMVFDDLFNVYFWPSITLHAQWEPSYTIRINVVDSEGNQIPLADMRDVQFNDTSVTFDGSYWVITLPQSEAAGTVTAEADGFVPGSETITPEDFTDGMAHVTITLLPPPVIYHTVTFNLHGGTETIPPQTVAHNGYATEPTPDPTRPDHIFAGWFTEEEDGEAFDFATMPITADTEIHARWTEYKPDNQPVKSRQAFLIGADTGLINPHGDITRAEVATIFFRLITDEARDAYWTQTHPFDDVQLTDWFNNAVGTTTNIGLFEGVAENRFAPRQEITRGELAAVLVRFMDFDTVGPLAADSDYFNDIADHWARAYINAAARNGWIQGPDGIGGLFHPTESLTRAEAAAMVNRIFGRLVETPQCLLEDMVIWDDNPTAPAGEEDSWYYLYIYMATNSYTYEWRADGAFKTLLELIAPREWWRLERPDSTPNSIFVA
ncbi:MAG: InlB B-repeat-containing protein [Oscillospiraceae bacterium]|nr:InlB B-repeat-containing protein [Oscillospiraceae bacterium]